MGNIDNHTNLLIFVAFCGIILGVLEVLGGKSQRR